MSCSDRSVQKLEPIGKEAGCRSGCLVLQAVQAAQFTAIGVSINSLQTTDEIVQIG